MTSSIILTIGSFQLEVQQSILVWFLICLIMAIVFIYAGKKIEKADPAKPLKGIVFASVEGYSLFLSLVGGNLREKAKSYAPLFGTMMLLMMIANLTGLVGLQNPTSNISFNLTLALTFFFMIQISAIKKGGLWARIKELSEPSILLLPMNIIGELALPLSLTMRLFGNVMAGTIIMMLIYTLIKSLGTIGLLGLAITPFLHSYFDVFAGLIQTYIFFTIGTYFLGEQVAPEEI